MSITDTPDNTRQQDRRPPKSAEFDEFGQPTDRQEIDKPRQGGPLVDARAGGAGPGQQLAVAFNPFMTTNAKGTFTISTDGMIQGVAQDDPAMRNQLAGGVLDILETMPMFGGVPISEYIPVSGPTSFDQSLGNLIKRATATDNMTGISVFNQAHHAINTPQSPAPMIFPGMSVHFYRFGSLARIPMNADPALMAVVPGMIVTPIGLFWDETNQWLTGAGGIALPTTLRIVGYSIGTSMTIEYNAGFASANWNRAGNTILLQI
jgi:hypothetical protein